MSSNMSNVRRVPILRHGDTVIASMAAREMATACGLTNSQVGALVTATSEVATNILKYGISGRITISQVTSPRTGIEVVAEDRGPGIADLELALKDHMSTGGTLGLGLPGARRLVDEFLVKNLSPRGLRVRLVKYR